MAKTKLKTGTNKFNVKIHALLLCAIGGLFVLTSCAQFQSHQNQIDLPNPDILGKDVTIKRRVFSTNRNALPVEVRFVIKDGIYSEIQAFYDERVNFEQIANAISSDSSNKEFSNLHASNFRLWGNPKHKYQIELEEYPGERIINDDGSNSEIVLHGGEKLLIYTK